MSKKPDKKIELFLVSHSPTSDAVKSILKAVLEREGWAYSEVVLERDVIKEPEAILDLIPVKLLDLPILKMGRFLIRGKSLLDQDFLTMNIKSFLSQGGEDKGSLPIEKA